MLAGKKQRCRSGSRAASEQRHERPNNSTVNISVQILICVSRMKFYCESCVNSICVYTQREFTAAAVFLQLIHFYCQAFIFLFTFLKSLPHCSDTRKALLSFQTFVNEVSRIHGNTLSKACQRSLRAPQMDSKEARIEDHLPTCCLNIYRECARKRLSQE